MGLKKLSKQCSICRYKRTCEHKQMEAIGCLKPATKSDMALYAGASALRETIVVTTGESPTIAYKDEIEKEIYKNLGLSLLGPAC